MATWIELWCERRFWSSDGKCWSHNHNGPADLAGDDAKSIRAVIAFIQAEARDGGWERTGDGWVCPGCLYRKMSEPV